MIALRPQIRQLEYFLAVAETLNFTRAAERINVGQQSLSTAVAQLEAQLRFRLFERTTRSVRLTEAGEAWLPYARAALAAADDAAKAAADIAVGRAGLLRVGLATTSALEVTPRVLRAYREAHPGVHVLVQHFDLADPSGGLRSGTSDVAIVRPPFDPEGLELHEIGDEPRLVMLAADHPLADRRSVRFREIEREPWVDVDTDPIWCSFWHVQEQRQEKLQVGARCRTLDDMLEAARTGAGIGLLPDSIARAQSWPGLVFIPVVDIPPSPVAVASRAGDGRPAVQRFVALVREPGVSGVTAAP